MKPEDSGLQTAMRALLSIIAGLLIADMLKNVVNTNTHMSDEEKTRRRERLIRWGLLSAAFSAVAAVLAVCFCLCAPLYPKATAIIAGYSVVSLVLSLTIMRKDYTGDDQTWRDQVKNPPTPA